MKRQVAGDDMKVQWPSFIGACVLTIALLLPHAPFYDILLGIIVAALLTIPLIR